MSAKEFFKTPLEWFGVITAIIYSLLVASNTGYEVLGFSLLFISAVAIGIWALLCKHFGNSIAAIFLRNCWYNWRVALAVRVNYRTEHLF